MQSWLKLRPRPGRSDSTSSPLSNADTPSNNFSIQPMYSTVRPFGTAATRWGVDFRDHMADHRQIEGLGHAGNLHPLRNSADPDQVDHYDVDRTRLDHVAERNDAVDEFATADWRR